MMAQGFAAALEALGLPLLGAARFAPFALEASNMGLARGGKTLAHSLSFGLRNGEALAILGDNGAGKSSLLRLMGGLLAAPRGALVAQGAPACHYVGHRPGLTAALSLDEHMRFWAARALPRTERQRLAALVQLEGLERRRTDQFSEGQRRRIVLLRLLLVPRAVWLLDEPFGALDEAGKALWQEAVAAHRARGGAVALAGAQSLIAPTRRLALGAAAQKAEG